MFSTPIRRKAKTCRTISNNYLIARVDHANCPGPDVDDTFAAVSRIIKMHQIDKQKQNLEADIKVCRQGWYSRCRSQLQRQEKPSHRYHKAPLARMSAISE